MSERFVGVVTHYFGKIRVAALKIAEGSLHVGDRIHVKGHTSDFAQTVESMQIEHESVEAAGEGDEVAIRVVEPAREHDRVYKVLAD